MLVVKDERRLCSACRGIASYQWLGLSMGQLVRISTLIVYCNEHYMEALHNGSHEPTDFDLIPNDNY